MTGLFLLFVAAIWFASVFYLTKLLTKKMPDKWWGILVRVFVFCALIPLPLTDEIVAKQQFEVLCEANSMIHIDRTTAIGKTVYYTPQPSVEIKGTWVRIILQPWSYVDSKGENVLSYNTLLAKGGLLIGALGISEGGMPLIFSGSCGPKEKTKDLIKLLQITALDHPSTNVTGN